MSEFLIGGLWFLWTLLFVAYATAFGLLIDWSNGDPAPSGAESGAAIACLLLGTVLLFGTFAGCARVTMRWWRS